MKVSFFITFEAEVKDTPAGRKVSGIKVVKATRNEPVGGVGLPIEFTVDLPESLFLHRRLSINAKVPEPTGLPTPVAIEAVPGSAWEEAVRKALT